MADQQCRDCHVQPGQPHDLGCDMARCPACGIQRLQCDAHGDDRTLDARAVWTGAAPTVVGGYRQRCTAAVLRFVLGQQELTSTSQIAWVGTLVDAVLAVRDQDAETLCSDNEELRKRADAAEEANAELDDIITSERAVREQTIQRADAAEAEVARLRAGEADQPAPDGTTLTPAQWLRRYNDATPEKRLEVVEHVQDSAERAYRCVMADHESLLAELRRVQAVIDDLATLVRDLADPHPCWEFEHSTGCRTHRWGNNDRPCPHGRARDILAAQEAGESRG